MTKLPCEIVEDDSLHYDIQFVVDRDHYDKSLSLYLAVARCYRYYFGGSAHEIRQVLETATLWYGYLGTAEGHIDYLTVDEQGVSNKYDDDDEPIVADTWWPATWVTVEEL